MREVEASPDGHLDLWAREHYKSTIITFAGVIQEVLCDPELTVAIFSHTNDIARAFLRQIKREFERNDRLKNCYPDVLWLKPESESPVWSEEDGIVVKRLGNPKEPTIGAWGVVDALPTGVHFGLRIYDDVITQKVTRSPEMIRKATEQMELSFSLGGGDNREQFIGTKYAFGDTYEVLEERKTVKVRKKPATSNGRLNGKPVFFTLARWEKTKRDQRGVVAAQHLQNPSAGNQNTFSITWFRPYEIRPHTMNVYIMCDPSSGERSSKNPTDRTGIAVVGVDSQLNKYLLDGARHRMRLSERFDMLRMLYHKWRNHHGVQSVRVGYEKYGMQSDLQAFEDMMRQLKEDERFPVDEINTVREGSNAKDDRIGRLQPDFEYSGFFLPGIIWNPDVDVAHGDVRTLGSDCLWKVRESPDKDGPQMVYAPMREPTPQMRVMVQRRQPHRVVTAIKRRDEDGVVYDVTKALMDEMRVHPFGAKKDLVDALSRIYDMEPVAPEADGIIDDYGRESQFAYDA